MVERRVNIGICRLRSNNLFWLNSHGTRWICKKCGQTKEVGDYSLELALGIKGQCLKFHVCHGCAEGIFDDAMSRFTLLKNHGPDGYRLLTEIDGGGEMCGRTR